MALFTVIVALEFLVGAVTISLSYGLFIGFLLWLASFTIILRWADKIVLVLLKARYVKGHADLINQIKNYTCRLGMEGVKVYWSSHFSRNIYFVDSFSREPSIVIGKDVYSELNAEELNSLLYASLLKIKTKEAKIKTMTSLFLAIAFAPLYLFAYFFRNKRYSEVFSVLIYPIYWLKEKMYFTDKKILAFDQQVNESREHQLHYSSALFKVQKMMGPEHSKIKDTILNDLVHIKNECDDIVLSALSFGGDVNKRLQFSSENNNEA